MFIVLVPIVAHSQKLEDGEKIEHVKASFVLQSFNNNTTETVTALYDRLVLANGTIENYCGKPICDIQIQFSSGLPQLTIEAHDIFIDATYDLNNDGIKELLVYHWWVEHSWCTISVYSLLNNQWVELQQTKAFVVDDTDYQNRVLKKKKRFYLIGDSWNKDFSETYKSKKRIHIKK